MSKKKRVNPILSTLLLKPLSLAYGAVTGTRNKMFDFGILAQREFDIPVLVVGNIAAGGTGKTPHTEYLVDLLRYRFNKGHRRRAVSDLSKIRQGCDRGRMRGPVQRH